jgi:hypothetical protein
MNSKSSSTMGTVEEKLDLREKYLMIMQNYLMDPDKGKLKEVYQSLKFMPDKIGENIEEIIKNADFKC